jgi:hypothetical protein
VTGATPVRALAFFEKLSQYDRVVFDASRSPSARAE